MNTNEDTEIKLISRLTDEEETWWGEVIQNYRAKYIKEPKEYAIQIFAEKGVTHAALKQDIEGILESTREAVWIKYLQDEAIFHKEVLEHLIKVRNLPKTILEAILEENFFSLDLTHLSKEKVVEKIAGIVGEYTGRVMPYIYQLSLSTTQSRRSRAGKVFEKIIETFFDIFSYSYQNQSSLGNASYNASHLGKKVDLIVPNGESYLKNRPKCAVITIKTSLRERWQEVAEELSRTNVPHIYLLTVDTEVTPNTVKIMKQYNITLVVYRKVKTSKFNSFENVQDYEEFFLKEMPHILSYWG